MLVRSGLARLLADAGVEVVAESRDADELMRAVALERPDVALVDIRMPPTHTDEGLVAARRIRAEYPDTAVLVLSQYLEPRYAQRLLADQPGGLGYLLKERVSDVAVLVDALHRVRTASASSTRRSWRGCCGAPRRADPLDGSPTASARSSP